MKPLIRPDFHREENFLGDLKEHKTSFDIRFSHKQHIETTEDLTTKKEFKVTDGETIERRKIRAETSFPGQKCLTTVTSVDKLYQFKKNEHRKKRNNEEGESAAEKNKLPLFLKEKCKKE